MIPLLTYNNSNIQEYPVENAFISEETKNESTDKNVKQNSDSKIYTLFTENVFNDIIVKTNFGLKKEIDSILEEFESIIEFNRSFYNNENINLPNEKTFEKMNSIIEFLSSNNIIPFKIEPSVEEGICMVFKKQNEKLYFEIYNDGDLGYIIENSLNKEIISNKDVSSIEEAVNDIVNFEKNEIS